MELFSWNVYVVNYWPGISECIPGHNSQIEGGAMQVTIHKLSVDVYPFFPAGKYITPRRSLSDSVTEINIAILILDKALDDENKFMQWMLNSWIKLLYENKNSDYDSYVIFVDQSKI